MQFTLPVLFSLVPHHTEHLEIVAGINYLLYTKQVAIINILEHFTYVPRLKSFKVRRHL